MFGKRKTQISIVSTLDTSAYHWCREAILLHVKHGMAALTTVSGDYDRDYHIPSQLQLHGTPLIQGSYPVCPTCEALLARGYGIENADCPQLREIRDAINQDYAGLQNAVEVLKPILGLLEDGYYVLADVPHTPTDGEDHFFANVPNALQSYKAAVGSYYNYMFTTVTNGYPAYLYPTQSNACLNIEHARRYMERMQSPTAPRAIAYYHHGFMSALLDGHHKAYAAAMLGIEVPCLTIIRMTAAWQRTKDGAKFCQFSEIELPKKMLLAWQGFQRKAPQEVTITPTNAQNPPISVQELHLEQYLTIHEKTGISAAGLKMEDITPELCRTWLTSHESEDDERLKAVLRYLTKAAPERAFPIAEDVIAVQDDTETARLAYRALLQKKTPETEQLFLNFIISHDAKSRCWDVVTTYWEEVETPKN